MLLMFNRPCSISRKKGQIVEFIGAKGVPNSILQSSLIREDDACVPSNKTGEQIATACSFTFPHHETNFSSWLHTPHSSERHCQVRSACQKRSRAHTWADAANTRLWEEGMSPFKYSSLFLMRNLFYSAYVIQSTPGVPRKMKDFFFFLLARRCCEHEVMKLKESKGLEIHFFLIWNAIHSELTLYASWTMLFGSFRLDKAKK